MDVREPVSQSGDLNSPSSAPAQWQSGYWWRRRHFHVPVIVWIVASVLGGAAIGNVLEPDEAGDKPQTTVEVVDEPAAAVACDENYAACVPVASDVDCVVVDGGTGDEAHEDVDGPSFRSAPVAVLGDDVYGLDTDHDGIGCD